MNFLAQVLLNGIINGLTIAVLAIAFWVVYVSTRIFCLALAAIYAAASYAAWSALQMGLKSSGSVALSLAISTALAVSFEVVNHRRLRRLRAPDGAHLLSSLGLYIAVVQVISMVWGKGVLTFRAGIDEVYNIGILVMTRSQVIAALASISLLMVVYIVLMRTQLGLKLRALSFNSAQLSLYGVNIEMLAIQAFALAGFLTGGCALLRGFETGFDAYGGMAMLLLAIVATVIGGAGGFWGVVAGALGLGVSRAFATWFFAAHWQEVVTFLLLALFVIFRSNFTKSANIRSKGV